MRASGQRAVSPTEQIASLVNTMNLAVAARGLPLRLPIEPRDKKRS